MKFDHLALGTEAPGALVFVSPGLDYLTTDGQSVGDMLRSLPPTELNRAILCVVDGAVNGAAFATSFPKVRLVLIDTRDEQDRLSNGWRHPPAKAYSTTPHHWRSAVVFRALASLAESAAIDYVEFPDRGGLAFCTLQERNLRNFLPHATIAVRLSNSYTQMIHAEAQVVDVECMNLSDLERKCLRDCDRVVAPLLPVAEETRSSFDFPEEDWTPRLIEHAFPVRLEGVTVTPAVGASFGQSLVFPSTVRRVNRPDLFIRAVAAFLGLTPAYSGPVVFGGPGGDPNYAPDVERLIPLAVKGRLEAMPPGQTAQRAVLLQDATVVISASWDVFCPVAYETSLMGARLIVNETNPAFGPGTPWQDGVNCLKFDGSVNGLVNALQRNIQRNEVLRAVDMPTRPWPWLTERPDRLPWRRTESPPLVSVVIAHYDLGAFLLETLASVHAQSYENIEIVLVDDASVDLPSIQAIEKLNREPVAGLKVIRLPGNVGLAAARNLGVQHARGRYILTLDADDLIHPDYIAVGVESLENRPEFDVVVTPAAYFLDGEPLPVPEQGTDFPDYAMFTGEAMVGGLIENRFSTATALFRASALTRFPYLESLSCYEDWSLYLRMCEADVRFIVTNDVFFYYRRRRDSMVHTRRDPLRKRIEYGDLIRTSAPESIRRRSRSLIVGIASPVAPVIEIQGDPAVVTQPAVVSVEIPIANDEEQEIEEPAHPLKIPLFGEPGQYDEQVVFASLKVSRWLERHAPSLLRGIVSAARWAWHGYRAARSKVWRD